MVESGLSFREAGQDYIRSKLIELGCHPYHDNITVLVFTASYCKLMAG